MFFGFAFSIRSSVLETCAHLEQHSCKNESAMNGLLVVLGVIFTAYCVYWVRYSSKKDTAPYHERRDLELMTRPAHQLRGHSSPSFDSHTAALLTSPSSLGLVADSGGSGSIRRDSPGGGRGASRSLAGFGVAVLEPGSIQAGGPASLTKKRGGAVDEEYMTLPTSLTTDQL